MKELDGFFLGVFFILIIFYFIGSLVDLADSNEKLRMSKPCVEYQDTALQEVPARCLKHFQDQ